MNVKKISAWAWFVAWLAAFAISHPHPSLAQASHPHQTQNVILVMIDGLRWQEVFRGADPSLLQTFGPDWLGDAKQMTAAAQAHYGGATPSQRRQQLMPFLWSTIAAHGQLFGNRDLGSDSHVINQFNFSYPGYAETLTGFADPRIDSNDNLPNPNPTVFAWLNAKPQFTGKVAAFSAWEVFNGIFDKQRCGFVVNAGYDPLTAIPATPELALLNALKAQTVRVWADEPFDPIPFHTAVEYIRARHPRVLFIGLGETDDWAHEGSYAAYLDAAHLADEYLGEIWRLAQSMPQYQGKTTLIVLPDHGRGEGENWTTHGAAIPHSNETWMAFLGPDTPALGERKAGPVVTESEIAATLAALLGEDYHAAVPRSSPPINQVLDR
jgi:hypothetical protein